MANDFPDSIGALWLKESKKGTKFMSGKIKIDGVEHDIMVFKNDKGDNPKRPDYRIFPSEPREDSRGATQSQNRGNDTTFNDDVPF